MITPKIKALFQFIEYLHSNIDNFKQYDEVINELHLLDKERKQVTPRKNFKDKLKFDEVQAEIKDKFKVIQENILQPIRTKATELNICDLNKTETVWNWNSTEIHQLKENFSKDDLPEIFSQKSKYIEYREKTKGEAFFGLGVFFDDLDEVLKELFDYFKEVEHNEFETFETKAIQVNDIGEAVKLMQLGHKKFTLPNSFLNPSTIQQQPNIEPLPPQPIVKQKPETKETELSERIKKHFGFFNNNCPRKHKQILNDTDFEKLIEWTICYFENKFKVPEISEPIRVVNTNKTFVQLAFKYLFKELYKSSPYPETLFEFYQSAFTPYSEDKKSNFEAVKNNDEVKKLMQIN